MSTWSGSELRAALGRAVRRVRAENLTDRAAALTYYGVLAIFPAMLVLVSILGLIGHSTAQELLNNVGQLAPGRRADVPAGVINQVQGTAGRPA